MKSVTVSIITLALTLPAIGLADVGANSDGVNAANQAAKCDHEKSASREDLYTNLERAVREVCGATDIRNAGSLTQAMNHRACVKEKMQLASKMLETRRVSALDEQKPQPIPAGR